MLPTILAVAHAALSGRWIVAIIAAAVWLLRELIIHFFSNTGGRR
jgi:hypothetical protein